MLTMKRYFLFLILLLPLSRVAAQENPPVVKLQALETWMKNPSDTLYVINFWATWCRPCVAELPYFDEITTNFPDQPVKVLLVSLDFVEDYKKRLLPFMKRKKPKSFVALLDEPKYDDWMGKVSKSWSGSIPATLFVSGSRQIRTFHEGEYSRESLFEQVKTLLE